MTRVMRGSWITRINMMKSCMRGMHPRELSILRTARSYTWRLCTCMTVRNHIREWIYEAQYCACVQNPASYAGNYWCCNMLWPELREDAELASSCNAPVEFQSRAIQRGAKRVKWIFLSALLLTTFAFQRSGRNVSAPRANREIGYSICL